MLQGQLTDFEVKSTYANLQEDLNLTNEIKNLNQLEFEQLLSKIQSEFHQDLITISDNYKTSVQSLLEKEQDLLITQYKEKTTLLLWIQQQLHELSQYGEQEEIIKDLIMKSKKQINIGCQAQISLVIGLIDQVTKQLLDINHQKNVNPQINEQPILQQQINKIQQPNETNAKLTCLFCNQSHSEVPQYRRHLKEQHQMTFTGYFCNDCDFFNKYRIDEFCNHMVKEHNKKTCVCGSVYQNKYHLGAHVKQCLKFFKQIDQPEKKKKNSNFLSVSFKNKP